MNRLEALWPKALRRWARADPVMAAAGRHKPPVFPKKPRWGGFESLVVSLLHQQVSTAAGRSITLRLREACGGRITPTAVQRLGESMASCGVSRQKRGYLQDLADRSASGEIGFRRLGQLDDEEVERELTKVKGIGPWTAQMFLLFHMHRPDVVAPADLGLQAGACQLYGLARSEAESWLASQAAAWSPFGSLASLLLWEVKDARDLEWPP